MIRIFSTLFFCLLFNVNYSQNPLKKHLLGNNETPYYSYPLYSFQKKDIGSVYVSDIVDNRYNHWGKQLNDSIKIELIRDFWKFPYPFNVKEKIKRDFSEMKIQSLSTKMGANYVLYPTIEIHYPNYVYSPKAYKILTRLNIKLTDKENAILFEKTYEDYFIFTDDIDKFDKEYHKDYKSGTNVAMWISIQRTLDKFYQDFDNYALGNKIENTEIKENLENVASNILNDKTLTDEQKPYSEVNENEKVKIETNILKHSKSNKQENTLKDNEQKDIEYIEKPPIKEEMLEAVTTLKSKVNEDSLKLIKDSISKINEQKAILAKQKKDKEIEDNKLLALNQKKKLDSIKKESELALKEKIDEKKKLDSLEKIKVNKNIELANAKKEMLKYKEQKKQDSLNTLAIYKKKQQDSLNKVLALDNQKEELSKKKLEKELKIQKEKDKKLKLEQELENNKIALEKALAEKKLKLEAAKIEKERIKNEKIQLAVKNANDEESKQLSKINEPKNVNYSASDYSKDSARYERERANQRNSILNAQQLSMDLDNGKASTHRALNEVPMKNPDNRTREEKLKDRIFVPKTDKSKELLGQVYLITKNDEKQHSKDLLSMDPKRKNEYLDSIAIAKQISKTKSPKKIILNNDESKKDTINIDLPPKSKEEDLLNQKEIEKQINEIKKSKKEIIDNALEEQNPIKDIKKTSTKVSKELKNNTKE